MKAPFSPFLAILPILLLIACTPLSQGSEVEGQETFLFTPTPRTVTEIRSRWNALKPEYALSPYATAPSFSPYAAGSLAAGFVQDGLDTLNFCRYLALLPDDVTIDQSLVSQAQHGAVLLAASEFSHTPAKPADMDQAFYDLGKTSTSSSNIGMGYSSVAASIQNGYMRDDDSGNIVRVGHRRWILNPAMKKTAFGYAQKPTGSPNTTLQAFDKSRSPAFSYSIVAWPAPGNFPLAFFDGNDPWTLTLNPAEFASPVKTDVRVTLKGPSGKTWSFSSADTNASGKYFNVDTEGYGVSNCVIWRPDGVAYKDGETWEAVVSGLKKKDGSAATVTVRTAFFTL